MQQTETNHKTPHTRTHTNTYIYIYIRKILQLKFSEMSLNMKCGNKEVIKIIRMQIFIKLISEYLNALIYKIQFKK